MALQIENNPINKNNSVGLSPSDIANARADLISQNTILAGDFEAAYDKINNQKEDRESLKKLIEEVFENIEKKSKGSKADREEAKVLQNYLNALKMSEKQVKANIDVLDQFENRIKKNIQEQNVQGKEALKNLHNYERQNEIMDDVRAVFTKISEGGTKLTKELEDATNAIHKNNVEHQRENETQRDNREQKYASTESIANQKLEKIIKEEVGKLGQNIKGLVDTLNINKIAQQVAVSAKQQLQGELQTNYNLSGAEFEKFKHDLYDQIDTSLYSNDEILAAMQTLNTTALGNTKTATEYFNDILVGQKVLGISSEAQQQLLKLGNITGRNELAFYQGTVAKFLNSNLGLNKQQLNELVTLNANLSEQAADLGITSEAFQETNMKATSALEATEKGAGARLTQAESLLLGNTDVTSKLLGMSSGQLAEKLNNGESITDILMNSGAGAAQAIAAFRTGDTDYINNMKEFASSAWGADNDAVWSTLRVLATNTDEFTKNYETATSAAAQDAAEAVQKEQEKQTDSLSFIQKFVNSISNNIDKIVPWSVGVLLGNILVGVSTIITLLQISGNIKEIASGLKGSSIGKSLLSGTGTKLAGEAGKTLGKAGLTKLGGIAAGAAGIGSLIGGISDAASMQGSEGSWLGSTARGFFLGTGSKEKSAGENALAVGGNALKGAGAGFAIGSMFGGPLIGGLIGAGVGLIGGLVGASRENKKLQEEQNKKLDDINKNTATTAENTAADSVGMVYRYRGTDNYSRGLGSLSGGGYSGHIARGPIGAMEDAGMPITSYWKQKRTYKNINDGKWYTDIHNGADFGAKEGTKLYSNATGTVTMNFTEKSGANVVGITDGSGYTHIYAHMQSRSPLKVGTTVNKGDFVGYVGKTGKVTGAHLHYTVLRPGDDARKNYWKLENTVDPGPFVSSSIFNGDSSTVISSANSESVKSSKAVTDLFGMQTKKVNLESIGALSGPIVDSIGDLKQTIIDLSARTDRNEKILNMLSGTATPDPII